MSSNLDPNTNQLTFHHGDPSIFTFHSADRHTSLDAIKYDFCDHIIFNVEFDKRMDLTSVPSVSNCRKAIQLKAGIDLPIVARPTLNSREVLTRITQKETRRVMVFERERERRRDI